MKHPKYKETQTLYWFVALFALISILIVCATYFQWGTKPIPSWSYAIPLLVVNILPILILYNMTITIDTEMARVQFGIGWLKREIPIRDLDLTTAEIVHLPWYVGIGYRFNMRGTFFNTRPGPALFIKTKNRNTEFFVGTKHGKEIIALLEKMQEQANLKA
ncbi:hypothetical protein [uncultured Dokdonia sp.]|uniref:hypothetical protein n=1 Tax=uncultured Dokdonia sp. TaxID=575653 RepID=UPI002624FE92|nr:hypothetical protein [uncultured Dokdonia sp.]